MARRRTHAQALALTAATLALSACGLLDSDDEPQAAPTPTVTVSTTPTAGSTAPTPSPTPAPATSSPPVADLDEALRETRPSTVRIETTDCAGSYGGGTGFLVGDDLVATAAHVVDDVYSISLRTSADVWRGEVVGIDRRRDVALLRSIKPFAQGRPVDFTTAKVEVEDEVGALGYPLLSALTSQHGRVQETDARVELEEQTVEGLLRLQLEADPGNSGGPLVDGFGDVVGITILKNNATSQGVAFAVPASTAAPLIDAWTAAPDVQPTTTCSSPWSDLITVESKHADAPTIASTLHRYFSSINSATPDDAWSIISGDLRAGFDGYEDFAAEYSTTTDSEVVLELADMVDETTNTADVRFRSRQDPAYDAQGRSCTDWHLRYTLKMGNGAVGGWVITGAEELDPSQPCADEVITNELEVPLDVTTEDG